MLKATFERLFRELEQLKNEERGKIAKVIDEARALGDLKENAEYHAAKERQGLMEARITEVGDLVSRAHVIDPSGLAHRRISFGSTVRLVEITTDEKMIYTIVGSQESDPEKGLISIRSPLAKLLLGKEEGDEIVAHLPIGKKEYSIEEVFYQEIVIF